MKLLWMLLSIIPVSFFFVYTEYATRTNQAGFFIALLIALMFVGILGFLSKEFRFLSVILLSLVSSILSMILSSKFIPNDGYYFVIVGRDGYILFVSLMFLLGVAVVRFIFHARMHGKTTE
ncbi:hypothetical protein M3221_22810 [Domibacillus indicus]|uniref:hypothetical protein n=1 Tax=Domibacillus indicus TaxID=1437523 RepID=UPI00203D242B|nr:hypothetical protein [Domibacillus indicus]MCM3791170.1 hypothetical protein [Domibacillus indicus]